MYFIGILEKGKLSLYSDQLKSKTELERGIIAEAVKIHGDKVVALKVVPIKTESTITKAVINDIE